MKEEGEEEKQTIFVYPFQPNNNLLWGRELLSPFH